LHAGAAWERHFPTDAELIAGISRELGFDADDLRDGRHMRRVNHIAQMIQVYYRQARATGSTAGLKKRAAVAAALWPDVASQQDVKRKRVMRKWEAIAERAGFLRVRDGRGERALTWELLDDWQRYALAPQRGYSSVGRATAGDSCEARRRRESRRERHERRVRPHCRRVGNKTGAVPRFLSPEKSAPSGLSPLKGLQPEDLHDTNDRRGRPPGAAAPESDQQQRIEQQVAEAERLFELTFGPPAAGPLLIAGPLVAALELVDRRFAQLAELNGWPAREGRALSYLEQLLGGEADARREEGRRAPRHLGFFVKPLRAAARRSELKCRERRRAMAAPGSRLQPRRDSGARRSEP
jgi:hypothetical protein